MHFLHVSSVYRITYTRDAVKTLARMPADRRELILAKVEALAADPHGQQAQAKPLKGKFSGMARLRVGDWRVLYRVDGAAREVVVGPIKPRGGAYDD
jgi:mRNA interferase RelE/StbE